MLLPSAAMSRASRTDAGLCIPRMVPWRDWDEWYQVKVSCLFPRLSQLASRPECIASHDVALPPSPPATALQPSGQSKGSTYIL